MNTKIMSIVVGGVALLLLAAGVAGALSDRTPGSPQVESVGVSGGINYQGRLTDDDGRPVDGTVQMRFFIYDAAAGGQSLWDSGQRDIAVSDGLFTVRLDANPAIFNGQGLWLSIRVEGETLSPRHELLAVPYALGLRPGAEIIGPDLAATDAALAGYAPSTGTALHADANGGAGLYGTSESSYGVWGASNDSWGGFFTSAGGHGIRVSTTGNAHFDHGAYITSNGGYGVYAQSAFNQAVRGEAGNVAGFVQPLGPMGVVGIGENRGMFASSNGGVGSYGTSLTNYGVWGQSTDGRGVTGRTSRTDNNYGLYTPDNLYSANINLTGAVMQVMQNNGTEALAPGDVVVFSGIAPAVAAVDGPVVQVSRAAEANSTAVAGVVFSRFNIDAVDPDLESPDGTAPDRAEIEVTPAGDAAPGEYILVVVQGIARVNANALGGRSIQPGDLLSTGGHAGQAQRAPAVTAGAVEAAAPGTVFAKALEPLNGSQGMIYVYVTLQ